jgi:lysophospholipase
MRPAFSVAALKLALPRFDLHQPIGVVADHPFVLQQYWQHYHLLDLIQGPYFFGLQTVTAFDIALHVWKPVNARATLWVMHGYFDHVGLFQHVIRWALAQQMAVVAFDLPGHGLSSGEPAVIEDFTQYREILKALLDQLQPVLPQPSYVVGQSTGGAIIIDTLLNPPYAPADSPWQKVVLLAPLVRPVAWRSVNMSYLLVKPFSEFVPRTFNGNTNDPQFLAFLENNEPLQAKVISARWVGAMIRWANKIEKAAPSLISPCIIQGDWDQTVDYVFNLSLLQRQFHQPSIHMLTGAYHHLVNESEAIRGQMFNIMQNFFAAAAAAAAVDDDDDAKRLPVHAE